MTSILILKPIIDVLYDEMKEYKEKTDKKIRELENELRLLRNNTQSKAVHKNIVVVDDSSDDEDYKEMATAPVIPSRHDPSPPTAAVQHLETQGVKEENSSTAKEEVKVVEMIAGKDRKEYMKEYQRNYRKKQKNNEK